VIRTLKLVTRTASLISVFSACLFASHLVQAQQSVPFRAGSPVAPNGLNYQILGEGPFEYATAEGMDIRVVVVARDIEYPMSMAFLPDEKILVVTRRGVIRMIDNEILSPEPVSGGPPSVFFGERGVERATSHGYIDIALHPDFEQNNLVYLSYTKPLPDDERGIAVGRGRWTGNSLEDFTDIWGGQPNLNGVTRLAFGQDGTLYLTTCGTGAQELGSVGGKVLRINDDGSIPIDNPFVNNPYAQAEIYSYGHRSCALGLAVHPTTGELWQTENGPNGGDEVNAIQASLNYGWPIVSLGRTYQGPWQSERPTHELFEPPVVYWMPSIAVSGMSFYTSDTLPKWKGDLFVGSLRTGQIPGTGHLERILFNENMQELRRESLLTDLGQRIRDVRQGPDGFIYLVTEEKSGAILRIEPAD